MKLLNIYLHLPQWCDFCLYLVNCEWGDWMTGNCPVTCGGGTRTNFRTKTIEELYNGTCEGEAYMEEACNVQHCLGNKQLIVYKKGHIH